MRKTFLVAVAGLTLAANVANGGLFNLRARLVSRTEVENTDDPSAAVLKVTEAYRGRVAQAQPTPADPLPPMPSPSYSPPPSQPAPVVVAPAPSAPENVAAPVQQLQAALPMAQYVRVRQGWKAHPCAVPMYVAVQDPCNPCCQVCVEICVPPCAVADIRCTRRGHGVVYDFGKYEVEIKQRGDYLLVDYDR
jgi:hypothetical protein